MRLRMEICKLFKLNSVDISRATILFRVWLSLLFWRRSVPNFAPGGVLVPKGCVCSSQGVCYSIPGGVFIQPGVCVISP